MPMYRCKNYGSCQRADRREDIELPPGAPPICPEPRCQKPLVDAPGGRGGSKTGGGGTRGGGTKAPFPMLLIGVVLAILALIGGIVWLMLPPNMPPLTVKLEAQKDGRVGDSLQVPIIVEPAAATSVTLSADGLPAGIFLDSPGRSLQGAPQGSGETSVKVIAHSEGYKDGSASIKFIIAGNGVSPSTPPPTPPPGPRPPTPPPVPPEQGAYDLVLTGSNTIGGVDPSSQKGLARDLVAEFCKKHWPNGSMVGEELKDVGKDEKERLFTYKVAPGENRRILIRPHGSKTSVEALQSNDPAKRADIGMSSSPRPELQNGFREYVIALDAVAVIVHPENPIAELTLDQIKQIFGPDPTLTEWPNGYGPIQTYGRDKKSGTTECFRVALGISKDAVIPYTGVAAGQPGRDGYEDTSKIVDQVATNRNAIGYVGRAANLPSSVKAVAVRPAPAYSAFAPNPTTIRTMEYSMARELFLYTTANPSPLASSFIRFCLDDEGQAIADADGFIGFRTGDLLTRPSFGDRAPQALRSAVSNCDRIVFSFRFRPGQANALDTFSSQNWKRLLTFLHRPEIAQRRLVIVGCVDSVGSAAANKRISKERAENFARLLDNEGISNPITRKLGFGTEYMLYDDKGDANSREAQRNRRVDVYIEK